MARIEFRGLAHSYRPNPSGPKDYALQRMDQVWEDGGAYALLGPSGCGKTTLLNIISGLIHPSEGRVLFNGKDMTELPTERRNIAQVFQFPVIYDTMTVFDNLAFPLRNRGVAEAVVRVRVQQVAEMLELSADLKRRASGLAADAKQKISLGRGLVRQDVAAILFDEPLTVIDPHLKWILRRKLKQIHHEFKLTLIYVTHDQTEALTFADRVVVMFEGRIVQIGTPQQLFEDPAHVFVGHFIGSPGMNLLPCQIDGNAALVDGISIPLAPAMRSGRGRGRRGATGHSPGVCPLQHGASCASGQPIFAVSRISATRKF
jgi:glycerol transport system ATP-binding protein